MPRNEDELELKEGDVVDVLEKCDDGWFVGMSCQGTDLQARGDSGTVVEKSFSNQKVASSIPCRSFLEQDTEPLIAPDVQCAISVNVKKLYTL